MDIKAPTNIKFFIPTNILNIDFSAEPTLEGLTGEDYLGNAIASGDQAINAMDTHAGRPVQVNTSGVVTSFRIDYSPTRRHKCNFILLDGHNLRNSYSEDVIRLMDTHYSNTDDFGTSTKQSYNRILSGLLNRQRPYIHYFPGGYINLGAGDEFSFVSSNFSLRAIFRKRDNAGAIISKRDFTNYEYYMQISNASAFVRQYDNNNSGVLTRWTTAIDWVIDELYDVVYTYDFATDTGQFYINGIAVETTKIIDGGGGFSDFANTAVNAALGGILSGTSLQFEGLYYTAEFWNKALSASEIADLYLGNDPGIKYRAASQSILTSGTLTTGQEYIIDNYVAGDDFTNVGGSNSTGAVFTATGTTPTTWTNGSSLRAQGQTAVYTHTGINRDADKWYDKTRNNTGQAISGVAGVRNDPVNNDDYLLGTFDDIEPARLFVSFNPNGLTGDGSIKTLLGNISIGEVITLNGLLPEGGYAGGLMYDGNKLVETESGQIQAESRHDARPTFDLQLALSTENEFKLAQKIINEVKGSLYPFYVSFNWDELQPVLHRVRLIESDLPYSYRAHLSRPWSSSLSLKVDI
jgi:hypothetical protein